MSPVVGLKKIVNLINGELKTPKIHQFNYLIDWLNKNHRTNITKLPFKDNVLSHDGWLSGFIDSDGSFSVQHTKLESGAKKRKISCRFATTRTRYTSLKGAAISHVIVLYCIKFRGFRQFVPGLCCLKFIIY